MAAGEDQPQPVIGQVGRLVEGGFLAAARKLERRLQRAAGPPIQAVPAQPVERLVAGGADQPGPRLRRRAGARPLRQRRGEGVLQRFFRQVEVADQPDQGREDPPALGTKGRLDGAGGGQGGRAVRRLDPGTAHRRFPLYISPIGRIGRTSIEPCLAVGIFAAIAVASSRLAASTT